MLKKVPRSVVLCVIALSGFLAILLLLFYLLQGHLLFHPQPVSPTMKKANAELEVSYEVNGQELRGWYVHPKAETGRKKLLIYYGGNAEEVSYTVSDLEGLKEHAILLLNYRGYGESSGSPSELALFEDALAVYDAVAGDYDEISVCGRSLGSGVATYVASQRPVRRAVLITPYDSMVNVAETHYGWLPTGLLVRHRFESVQYAEKVTAPALMLSAENDTLIPANHTEALLKKWPAAAEHVVIDNAGHNDLTMVSGFWEKVYQFLEPVEHTAALQSPQEAVRR